MDRQRLLRIGIVAAVLFAANLVGRLVVRIGAVEDVQSQQQITVLTYASIGLIMAVMAVLWARLRPAGHVIADLAAAMVVAGVLILLIGPFVSGTTPATVGVGDTFDAAWQYAGFAAGGGLVGLLSLIAVGGDYTSRSLKQFVDAKRAKPHRAVRG